MTITAFLLPKLLRSAAALTAAATLALPAQATLVQGDWDPAYGAPFASLGWRGTSTINVPTTCLGLSGLVLNNGVSCALATVINADVEFYDVANPVPTVETLDFLGSVDVESFFVSGGVVTAFALDSTARVASTSSLAVIPAFGTNAFFELNLDIFIDPTSIVALDPVTIASLPWYQFAETGDAGGSNEGVVRVDVRTVPVPGSLALAGLALLGAALMRQRG